MVGLGSGLGLTGLVLCKNCKVNRFTFTDFHHKVMQLLAQNISINSGMDHYLLPPGDQNVNDTGDTVSEPKEVINHACVGQSKGCDVRCDGCWCRQENTTGVCVWRHCAQHHVYLSLLDWETVSSHDIQHTFSGTHIILASG